MLAVRRGSAALSLVVGTAIGVVVLADDTEFAARLKEAKEAVASGAGKDYYDGAFSRAFQAQHDRRHQQLEECRKRAGASDVPNFDMLLKLAGDGQVETAMSRPESKTANCYAKLIKKEVFPRPPSTEFWTPVSLRFGESAAIEVPVPPPTSPTQVLIANLSSEDPSVRSNGAWQLAGATELPAEALSMLEILQGDADGDVRYAAAWALGHLRPTSDTQTTTSEKPPKVVRQARLKYPLAAYEAGIQGTVLVDLLIGEKGEVAHIEIRQSIPALDAGAIATVREWQFQPKRVNGLPRASRVLVPCTFRVHKGSDLPPPLDLLMAPRPF